jgi:hypothetical protein
VDFSIRIIEESVLERVEDACLHECEEDNSSQYSYRTGMYDDEPSVEAFVNRMQEVWEEKAEEVSKEASITVNQNKVTVNRCDSVRVKPPEATSTSVSHGRKKQVRKKILVPSVYGIKKIARLSEEDRNALIRALKIEKRNRALKKASKGSSVAKQGTSLSAGTGLKRTTNNSKDLKSWIALHGKEQKVQEDVEDLGVKLGVKCSNSFQALSGGKNKASKKGREERK